MTTVNNASSTSNVTANTTANKNSQLSESTKAKLKALGIDPSTVSSETQAQQLIANAEQTSFKDMVSQDSTQESSNSLEQEYLSEAQTLAGRIGVSYSDDDSVSDILSAISSKLDQMMASAAMDPQQLQMIQYYQMELNQISTNYSAAQIQAQAQSASNYKIQDS